MGVTVSPVKIEESSPVTRQLSFEIPWKNVEEELDVAYRNIAKTAKIKGFRAGKTPRKILEIYYKDQAEGEAVSNLVMKYYTDAIQGNGITPVDKPKIDQKGIEINKDFQFVATVEIEPVIEPKDYVGLKIQKREINVTAQDVTNRIDQVRQMYSTLEEVKEDRTIKDGDLVTIDFMGKVDNKDQKELSVKDYPLKIGSKVLFENFEEQLIGSRKGEEKEIAINLPENFRLEHIAGKECVFTVKIKELREQIVPKLDKEFIKNFEKYETIKDFKEDVRDSLEREEESNVKIEIENQVIEKLLENNNFEVPSIYVERQIYLMMLNAHNHMINRGMNPDEALKISSSMRDKLKDQAEKTVKATLLLQKIAEKESIACNEEELEKRFNQINSDIEATEQDDAKERIRNEIINQNTVDYLLEHADIEIVKKDAKEKETT